ncbi:MAG: hypothetical protein LQ337_004969 [Flavoplaca oasis]|nr:MAG: hypothetical protein LQ337_004969 [Flavoplaca oasis]
MLPRHQKLLPKEQTRTWAIGDELPKHLDCRGAREFLSPAIAKERTINIERVSSVKRTVTPNKTNLKKTLNAEESSSKKDERTSAAEVDGRSGEDDNDKKKGKDDKLKDQGDDD